MDPQEVKNIIEFALLAAGEPLGKADFQRLLDGEADIAAALEALEEDWRGRGMRLARVADGWQFISREGYMEYLRRLRPRKTARLSRQLMEVLAVIAYRQPATRGDIEQLRGVSVSSMQIAALEELGWVNEVGRRETPGRPVLYGTTKTFLNDLALSSLGELPKLEQEDIEAAAGEDSEDATAEEDSGDSPVEEDSAAEEDSENFAAGKNSEDSTEEESAGNSAAAEEEDSGEDFTDGADGRAADNPPADGRND